MNKFFLAFGLILFFSLMIVCYYWIKQLIKNQKIKSTGLLLRKKQLTDEKEYVRNFVSYHIPLLIKNEIQWILIWSKNNSNFKIEISFNALKSKIEISGIKYMKLKNHLNTFKDLGVDEMDINIKQSCLKVTPNAKIITDVIYYIFENTFELNKYLNLKIVTSTLCKTRNKNDVEFLNIILIA